MPRGPYDVWAPRPHRVRLLCGDNAGGSVVEMQRGDDDWWTPAEPLPAAADHPYYVDYGYLLDDDPDPRPDPRSRRQPGQVARSATAARAVASAATRSPAANCAAASSVRSDPMVGT